TTCCVRIAERNVQGQHHLVVRLQGTHLALHGYQVADGQSLSTGQQRTHPCRGLLTKGNGLLDQVDDRAGIHENHQYGGSFATRACPRARRHSSWRRSTACISSSDSSRNAFISASISSRVRVVRPLAS